MTASAIVRAQLAAAAKRRAPASAEMLRGPVDLDTLEQCRREVGEMLGVYPVGTTRTSDACAGCGDQVEPGAAGPCCGTEIAKDEVFAMQPEQVTAATLTDAHVRAVHRLVTGLLAPTLEQARLRFACERVLGDVSYAAAVRFPRGTTLAELHSVVTMTLEQCRELVAAAWNEAAPRLQVEGL